MELLPVDLEQFWKDDALAHEDNCFSPNAPQVALGIRMSEECVYSEFGEQTNNPVWMPLPRERRIELNKRYNDKAEKVVGIRLLEEDFPTEEMSFTGVKRIGEVFGGRYIINDGSEWLESDIKTYDQLEEQLDKIDKMNLREFILPPGWDDDCRIKYERFGVRPPRVRGVRGPVTLACSIFGVENLIFLLVEEPDLAKRFSETMAKVIIGITEVMDAEAREETTGFFFADDNCCMLNPELYDFFAYPILKQVFDRFAPEPHHIRYQHSDSAMEHLLPILGRFNFTGVNFGPTVTIDKIREHMPKTRIDGCIAPYTFMGTDKEQLISEAIRDCEMAKQYGRGVNLTAAGSINFGSSLENMYTVMQVICQYGRY